MTGDRLREQIARIPTVRSHTATLVGMDEGFALINTGVTQIRVPCVGYYPPRVGGTVQVEWRDGKPAVIGPAVTRNPLGTITGTGTPKAEVTVDGVAYLLPYEAWYTPVVSDVVSVDWQREVIVGALSVAPAAPAAPSTPGVGVAPFDLTVRAENSGKWSTSYSNYFGGSEVWAGTSTNGLWVYGNAVRDAVGGAPTFSRIEIYLPLISQTGACEIGVHAHASLPGGGPSITSAIGLSPRGGWVPLPTSFADYLAAGGRGIGVTDAGGGFTKWRGISSDSLSGALRLIGTR